MQRGFKRWQPPPRPADITDVLRFLDANEDRALSDPGNEIILHLKQRTPNQAQICHHVRLQHALILSLRKNVKRWILL
jgi:hypothetical protein